MNKSILSLIIFITFVVVAGVAAIIFADFKGEHDAIPAIIGLVTSILSSLILPAHTLIKNFKRKKKVWPKDLAIASLMSKKRGVQTFILSIFLLFGGISYYFAMHTLAVSIDYEALIFVTIAILFLNIRQYLLDRRIERQEYGYNSYEAKEFLLFIQKEAEKTDFTSGGGRKIFDKSIKKEEIISTLSGQGGYSEA